jgi:uncharacterized membrane protein YtjA (UPF0391 family)
VSLLEWALILAVLAVFAGLLGFGDVASGLGTVAKVLFFIFLAGVVVVIALGALLWRTVT